MSTPALHGSIALVTGGTTGIGLATARLFHAQGARVIVTGQNPDTLEAARRELPDDVVVLRADARSIADADRLADEVRRRFGRLDVLFLNAGIARIAPLEAVDEAFYDDVMDINVKGVVFTLQKLLPLLATGASVLVNTSVVDQRGVANWSVYSASKGALSALVRSLAVELAPRQIRVNAIAPGPTETPIFGKAMPTDVIATVRTALESKIPLGRFGVGGDVAHAALFLASPSSAFLTGIELPVDGGLLAA